MPSPDAPPPLPAEVVRAHERALAAGCATYVDPLTGYEVLTADALAARGACCGRGCRHCPFTAGEQRRAGRPHVRTDGGGIAPDPPAAQS